MVIILVVAYAFVTTTLTSVKMNNEASVINSEVIYARKTAEIIKSSEDFNNICDNLRTLSDDVAGYVIDIVSDMEVHCELPDGYSINIEVLDCDLYFVSVSFDDIEYNLKVMKL